MTASRFMGHLPIGRMLRREVVRCQRAARVTPTEVPGREHDSLHRDHTNRKIVFHGVSHADEVGSEACVPAGALAGVAPLAVLGWLPEERADRTSLYRGSTAAGQPLRGGKCWRYFLQYDSAKRAWVVITWGGGAWSLQGLVSAGVPEDAAKALLDTLRKPK